MKYFSITELTKSDTAKRLGIDNAPSDEIKNNLKVKIRKEDNGYVVVELLYKDEVIDSDWMVDYDDTYESELPIGF